MNTSINRLKQFYQVNTQPDLSKLDEIYSSQVIFRDPLHELRGLPALRDYMSSMYSNIAECRFEYLDQLVSDNLGYIKWNMHYRHPSLGNKLITVRGMSQLQFDERIYYHEDIYDVGEMIYEHIPLLGYAVRSIKKRVSGA